MAVTVDVIVFVLAGLALMAYQRTRTTSGHIVTGVAAMVLGVLAFVLAAALILG